MVPILTFFKYDNLKKNLTLIQISLITNVIKHLFVAYQQFFKNCLVAVFVYWKIHLFLLICKASLCNLICFFMFAENVCHQSFNFDYGIFAFRCINTYVFKSQDFWSYGFLLWYGKFFLSPTLWQYLLMFSSNTLIYF